MELQLIETNLELDFSIIPFFEVIRLINALHTYPVPDNKELAVQWLTEGGGRPSEIKNRKKYELILDKYWVWCPGKKQHGTRTEIVSENFKQKFHAYLEKGTYCNEDIFGIYGESLARYINGQIRPKLGGRWLVKRPEFIGDGRYRLRYVYELKNLRHNFQTVLWNYYKQEFGQEVAISMTAKKMCHSDHRITARHYLASAKALELDTRYKGMTMIQIMNKCQNQVIGGV